MPAIHRHEFCHKRLHDQIFNARNFTQQTRVNRDYLYNTVKQCNCMNISNLGTFTAHHVYSCTGWRILLWSCCWWKMNGVKSKVSPLCICCVVPLMVWLPLVVCLVLVYDEIWGQLEKSTPPPLFPLRRSERYWRSTSFELQADGSFYFH